MPFLVQRFLHAGFVVLFASVLTFAVVNAAPGDFFEQLRTNPEMSAETLTGLRSTYGVDQPLATRYLDWMRSGLRGEWGFSFAYQAPAGPILWRRAKTTLLLTMTATLLAWLAAVPLGCWSAARADGVLDQFLSAVASVFLSIPEIVVALLLVIAAVRTGWFPAGGMKASDASVDSAFATGFDIARHLVLPAACLAAGLFPVVLLHTRNAVRETLRAPFIAAAQAHGISFRRLLFHHALRAAATPLLTLFGLSLGTLLSSSMLVETIFGWPGMGQLLLEAILERDFFLVIDSTVLATALFLAGNFVADIAIYANDARIRRR